MAVSIAGDAFGTIGGKVGEYTNSIVGTSLFGAVVGGFTSKFQGGNFWEGATIGLTVSLLNPIAQACSQTLAQAFACAHKVE